MNFSFTSIEQTIPAIAAIVAVAFYATVSMHSVCLAWRKVQARSGGRKRY